MPLPEPTVPMQENGTELSSENEPSRPAAPRPPPDPADAAQEDGRSENSQFPIVGVGASAGGLEAFSQLLAHLPDDTGMAFVLVQHLDPTHESQLGSLLARSIRMPVQDAAQDLEVQPDHVYVIPPNTTLSITEGRLRLEPRGEARAPHLPVDHFFKSLAEDRQTGAIGVILSGTGTDGTLGLEEIKAAGGITFAQDDQTARHTGMPQSAVRSGCVDLVLSPEEIARELVRIGRHPYLTPAAQTEARGPETAAEKDHFKKILALLHSAFGVDFSAYRDTTIKRRITRRMVLHTRESLADYARHLEGDRAELDALYQDILINVTSFFREPETFEALKSRVFPAILEGKDPNTPIRVWAPGCSTGQEAYSLAIALLEFLEDKPVHPPIQIFATDLSDTISLQKAREGIYPENIEAEVSPERLRRFFSKEDNRYRVSKALRDMVVFARQNVAADPPFSRVDLISCRNLLIYLAPPLQRRVLPTFHYALNPTGFLVLGHSETVGPFTDLFGIVDQPHRIYAKKATAARQYPHFHAEDHRLGAVARLLAAPAVSPADWQREADRVALGQYAPPGVLVNENLDILQFRGQTGPYLTPAPGEPSLNLLKMTREGLFLAVRAAVRECQQQGAAVHKRGVRVRGESVDHEIVLHVLPIKLSNADQRCYLVLFEESSQRATPPPEAVRPEPAEDVDAAELGLLRQELASTREYLQSVIEQQEAANEELRSANEEILSSNEELQSTNEELETAKEELQSVNEELTTVNEQLQNRNVDLGRLNDQVAAARNYAEAILRTTREPLVVLRADLRVNTANEAFYRTFQATPEQTEGQLVYDLGNGQWAIPALRTLLEDILPRKSSFEDFEVEHDFQTIGRRAMLLNARQLDTVAGEPGLILLAIEDVTERKQMQDDQTLAAHELRRYAAELSEMDRRKNEFLALLAHELRNPLAPILNAQHIIRLTTDTRRGEGDGGDTLRSASGMIERQTVHLARLVDDLLDVSRISRGTIGLRSERIDLASVVHHAVEAARPRCQDYELTTAIPPKPIYLQGDPIRLAQVVGNLLNNACKFTDRGGSIRLTVEQIGQQAILRVRDNGIGIAAEHLPRIFDMFTQVETSLERSHGGLGIGLTLVKSLVGLHGGTVEAHSAGLGQGSELVVRLPILAEVPEPRAPAAGDPTPAAPRRILVVDDNRDTAESLALLLELTGHETHTAFDGVEAVEAAAALRPDVILLDIGLPKLNGYEAARQIRAQQGERSLVLVALTGWGQAEDHRRSEAAGFNTHLVKPVDLAALTKLLAELQPTEG